MCGIAGVLLLCPKLRASPLPSPEHPLPTGVLAWDALAKDTNIVADAGAARFVFNFTNLATGKLVVQQLLPSCGCTTTESPPLPWGVSAGTNGHLRFTVNLKLMGKARKQAKLVRVVTDQGFVDLTLRLNVVPPRMPSQSEPERARALKLAQADRQALFRGECATCHAQPAAGKEDGRALYYAVCAACHEGNPPGAAPDLFAIKTPTNVDFWLNWISHGKAGSLMPGFSKAEGGPLSEMQIAYLARYLNTSDTMDEP